MSGEELRALAEDAWMWFPAEDHDGMDEVPWMDAEWWSFVGLDGRHARFTEAANPTAVLALLDERDAYREQWHDLCDQLRDANDAHDAMGAERDALRAAVERARALADEWDARSSRTAVAANTYILGIGHVSTVDYVHEDPVKPYADRLRDALDGPQ